VTAGTAVVVSVEAPGVHHTDVCGMPIIFIINIGDSVVRPHGTVMPHYQGAVLAAGFQVHAAWNAGLAQFMLFCSSTMKIVAAMTSTTLGDGRHFKGERDAMGLIWCWLAHDQAM
jgi:hypothetical protein